MNVSSFTLHRGVNMHQPRFSSFGSIPVENNGARAGVTRGQALDALADSEGGRFY